MALSIEHNAGEVEINGVSFSYESCTALRGFLEHVLLLRERQTTWSDEDLEETMLELSNLYLEPVLSGLQCSKLGDDELRTLLSDLNALPVSLYAFYANDFDSLAPITVYKIRTASGAPKYYRSYSRKLQCQSDLLHADDTPSLNYPYIWVANGVAVPDIEMFVRAKAALDLEQRLSALGVQLRLAFPPFNNGFNDAIEAERCFQLKWSLTLLELFAELSVDEQEVLPLPEGPFTSETVLFYVSKHKESLSKRGFWGNIAGSVGIGVGLSQEEGARKSKIEEELCRSWSEESNDILSLFQSMVVHIDWPDLKGRFDCVEVSGGHFMMGALPNDGKAFSIESPRHEVFISEDMVVMKYLVTQVLYESVMGSNPSHFKGADRPVESVSWLDAVRFANALSEESGLSAAYEIAEEFVTCDWSSDGWRLPTEAEWEYLARGGEELRYSGSDDSDAVAWYDRNSGGKSHPVGQKASNAFGLYDMSGNVWEWTWDRDGDYSSEPVTDPRGPSSGWSRVLRGGSWDEIAECVRSSFRHTLDPSYSNYNLGFRFLRKK